MTDYHPTIIEHCKRNCLLNKCKDIVTTRLDWKDYEKTELKKYDIIIGSDIVYFGCPVKELYGVFKRFLKDNGIGIIIIPDRKNYADLFLKLIEPNVFEVKK